MPARPHVPEVPPAPELPPHGATAPPRGGAGRGLLTTSGGKPGSGFRASGISSATARRSIRQGLRDSASAFPRLVRGVTDRQLTPPTRTGGHVMAIRLTGGLELSDNWREIREKVS